MPSIHQAYQRLLEQGKLQTDAAQADLVAKLSVLQTELEHAHKRRWFKRWRTPPAGIYVHGKVGIGKTVLMDLFYDNIDVPYKQRWHFHRFMRQLHQQLNHYQGQVDPIKRVVKQLAKTVRLICFDEFFVNDITDAMLLGKFLRACLDAKICFVITSNCEPDRLYWHGVQRDAFLPSIALIKQEFTVFAMPSHHDYRVQALQAQGTFFDEGNKAKLANMHQLFQRLQAHADYDQPCLSINQRAINTIALGEDAVWFDFAHICHAPRNCDDYLAIAEQFSLVFISHLRQLRQKEYDTVRYLMNLIDVLYDQRIKLVMSSRCAIQEIYPNGPLRAEFARTESRLLAMQTQDYLQQTAQQQ